jgi:hypothetical protein
MDETLRVLRNKFHAKPIVLESALFIMTMSADGRAGKPGEGCER